jgi:hypothetical protein
VASRRQNNGQSRISAKRFIVHVAGVTELIGQRPLPPVPSWSSRVALLGRRAVKIAGVSAGLDVPVRSSLYTKPAGT